MSGPWFVRYCDDERHMCMTVISTKDYGPSNIGQFGGEEDTVAIVYHQCSPFVCSESDDDLDERDKAARLIAAAPSLAVALAELMEVFPKPDEDPSTGDICRALVKARAAMAMTEVHP